ncbi:MAG: ribosome biogenesis GTPase YlqF [Clostridia bacterium]|nr:ribosome biogenesis GTPase YlqF [Clostridia bacterium]
MNNKKDNEEVFSKVSINWFPGHMAKTIKQIEEDLKLVDVIIELLDARIPIASQNPDIKKIIEKSSKNKKRIIILNKSDLADKQENEKWIQFFRKEGITAITTDANSGNGINECIRQIEKEMQEEISNLKEKGRVGRKIRAMVVGIPNVGKSSFINRIAKKTSAEVGNKPGVTKAKQWIRINDNIELLDTPGILWPKFEDQNVALNLSYIGTIKDEILDQIDIAYNLLKYLLENYKLKICERYKIDENKINEILDRNEDEGYNNIYDIMLIIGKNRGALMSGGKVDEEKTSRLILDDFRTGKFGRITLEKAI